MSEIVYVDHTKQDVSFSEYGNIRQAGDSKITIFQSEHKVAVVCARQIVGVPTRHDWNGTKRWYKWATNQSLGFRRNSAGNVVPYKAVRPWDSKVGVQWTFRKPDEVFGFLDGTGDMADAFKFAVQQTFDIKSLFDVYPMAEEYGINNYNALPNDLRPAMRNRNWNHFTEFAFGKTRVSSKMVDAVRNTEPYMTSLARQFRGLVPNDDIVKFLEKNHFDDEMEEGFSPYTPDIRKVVMAMDVDSRRALLKRGIDLTDTKRIRQLTMRDAYKRVNGKDKYTAWQDVW